VNLAMSICTLMRGDLPLHGASVGLDGRRIVVLAPSGTGKSTLLWRLLDSGARLANDDVTPIRQADGQVLSWSAGGLHAKLSRAALEACALDPAAYRPWLPDAQEFWVPVEPARQAEATGPLAAIFALHPLPEPPPFAPVMARRQFAGAAVGHLMANTQGLWAAYTEIDARHLLQTYTAIARSVPVYVLEYYRCFEILPALERTICELVEASADEPMAAEPSEVRNRRRSRPNAWHAVLDRLRDAPRLRRSGSRVTPVP
jgi:hypothetical protein